MCSLISAGAAYETGWYRCVSDVQRRVPGTDYRLAMQYDSAGNQVGRQEAHFVCEELIYN